MPETRRAPALTAEEWRDEICDRPSGVVDSWSRVGVSHSVPGGLYVEELQPDYCAAVHVDPRARHALAALALYGQPFGFTHGDLDVIQSGVLALREANCPLCAEELEKVADRLRALLPPE